MTGWRQILMALPSPRWPAAVAALMAFLLLLAFQQVVATGVQQADLRRAAVAAQVEAVWRCKLLSEVGDRRGCLTQVAAQ
jgi:hypothetical protein